MQHPILNIAVKAARRAGNVILRHADRLDRIRVQKKAHNDFVTEIDRMAESEIVRTLRAAFPNHGILAEESGHHAGDEYQWIIDPLDGTTNYIHGNPQYAVSIALRRHAVLEQAVVFDPVRNELFTASRGRGAALDDQRIRVSQVSRLEGALIGTGFPFRELEQLDVWIQTFRDLVPRTQGLRRAGAAALDLAYVAAGRFDGFWESGLSAWDMAAGCLLITEAGGLISDFCGEQGHLESGSIVAANTDLHSALLEIVRRNL